MTQKKSFIGIIVSLLIAASVTLAGSTAGTDVGGIRLFALCSLIIFIIQWVSFIPSWIWHTERFFDLVGSATYLTVIIFALITSPEIDARSFLLVLMIGVWGLRLGSFLFARVQAAGHDIRFEIMKHRFVWFLMTWTIQGLWVLLTSSTALAAITSNNRSGLGWIETVGILIWLLGFTIEVVADEQKRKFKLNPVNKNSFIREGLWSWSQHPNYFGEIVLWVGIAIISLPVLSSWQYVTLVSPIFVFVLLTRISGIPMLDFAAKKRWGGDTEFLSYIKSTSKLIPKPPSSSKNLHS